MTKPLTNFINNIGKHLENNQIAMIEIASNHKIYNGIIRLDRSLGVIMQCNELSTKYKNLYNFIKNEEYDKIIIKFNLIHYLYYVSKDKDNYIFNIGNNEISVNKEEL